MAGIYIHIPFCRQKCYYCDFYKTVNTTLKPKFLQSLKAEAKVRKNYLGNEAVETIYFGGGTPSVLEAGELADILEHLNELFEVKENTEITFEANPDDLTPAYLKAIKQGGVNRLSVGIQALQNQHLQKMNRRHDASQAIEAIHNAAKIGFNNISVDLIYGLPGLTESEWKDSLSQVFELPVQHLSAYHLTYHEGTAFYTWLKKGTLRELSETESVKQFEILIDKAASAGFEQYEISNFARNELYSQHNTSYWQGKKYLGLGPSAHSFDQQSRRWNTSHVESYIKAIDNGLAFSEEEILSENDRYNEYILTRIRTKWGVSLTAINELFGEEMKSYFLTQLKKYVDAGLVNLENDRVTLPRKGLFVSDEIMTDLMII
ncbi:radical SAM family heme chaperone HemW [Maribellus sp. CM-23]|uniref:radical SAM family heme chaperone HemW n=1 Tax=Maribellus sp. CM-23 TaxID=2781026 RepID=UPI001F47F81E|nr:radical SAM family heme chaperone HemW [Maribellus sp. CM-23]MCE4564079.1 radical SAM family heme chaperone HemW [Maribellus sp. CM-23]